MPRADLIVNLVRAGRQGDQNLFRSTVEAMAAEERAKHHNQLADRLEANLRAANARPKAAEVVRNYDGGHGGLLYEIEPHRTLDSMLLPSDVLKALSELIEEQRRRDILRSYGLEPRHRVLLSGPPGNGKTTLAEAAVAPEMHTFTDGLQAIGTAQARESIVLTPKVADTIRRLRFESGDRVRAGQVLVEMSSVEQAADMAEARAANQAAQEDLRRTQELFNRGFASQARLDTVQAAADAAAARLNAGGSRIADRTIRAPFAGVVGLRLASPGQYVRPGDQIGTLDDTSEIKLDFTVTETQIARIVQGVNLVARTAAYPDGTFTGTIANVDSRVDPATRTVRVRAMLPNEDGTLRPGMLMTVDVQSNPREALAIPEIAILDQIDG